MNPAHRAYRAIFGEPDQAYETGLGYEARTGDDICVVVMHTLEFGWTAHAAAPGFDTGIVYGSTEESAADELIQRWGKR